VKPEIRNQKLEAMRLLILVSGFWFLVSACASCSPQSKFLERKIDLFE